MIAEDLQGDASITTPVDAGGYGFNAQWDDGFCGKVRWAATAPSDNQRNIADLAGALAAMGGVNAFQSILYSENHDKDDPGLAQGGTSACDHRQRTGRQLVCQKAIHTGGLRGP